MGIKKFLVTTLIVVACTVCSWFQPMRSEAKEQDNRKYSIRAYTGFLPLVSGQVINDSRFQNVYPNSGPPPGVTPMTSIISITYEQPSQSYSDVYIGGIPLILELDYRFTPTWSGYAGIGFQYFPAKTFDFSSARIEENTRSSNGSLVSSTRTTVIKGELDDLYRIPIFIGGAYHFSDVTKWKLDPYFRADVGWIIQPAIDLILSAADTPTESTEFEFWETSVLALIDIGVGVEARVNSLGVFGEVRLQYSTAPGGKLTPVSNSTGLLTVPLFIGVSF